MPKLTFSSVISSFVSLLLVFVIVAVAVIQVSPTTVYAAIDSGIECSTSADCVEQNAGNSCINNSCRATPGYVSKDSTDFKTFIQAKEETQKTGKSNIQDLAGVKVLPSIANGFRDGFVGDGTTLASNSVLGVMTQTIVYMYEAPAASSYIAAVDFLNNAGIPVAQPAYAQNLGGLGFASLNPILEAWKTFRNIAYLFFVVIILVIGFMIMFRQKMGQSAVTAQQAIPSVIVALVTVTFSYAIAGLLIDAMYVIMALLVAVFGFANNQSAVLLTGPLDFFVLVRGSFASAAQAVQTAVEGILSTNNLGLASLSGWTVGLIVAIAIVFAIFRLFFELLKTYVTIIISITLSPLLLMLGAVPGKNVFGGWIKGLVGNLAAFPTVLLILLIYDQLTGNLSDRTLEAATGGGFSPPYLFGTVEPGGIAYFFISLGLLLIMTDLVKEAKKALGATGGVFDQFGTAFGDAFKKGWTGGELIPGVGLTDTSKLGISGKQITRTAGVGAGSLLGGAVGGARGIKDTLTKNVSPDYILKRAQDGARLGGRVVADATDSGFFAENRKERAKVSPLDLPVKIDQLTSKEGK